MKITNNNLFVIIEADEGFILVDKNTGEGHYTLYLGKNDNPSNYNEIPASEYVEPTPEDELALEEMILNIFDEEVNK